jgi:lactate dehydrogenase-like 2-hydroxyacid dehydrogenase
MFKKIVAIEPVSLIPSAEEKLHEYANEVILFDDIPKNDAEIIRRIGDADAVLLSYTSRIEKNILDACPDIRYIGMCCSLYSEASANVDIRTARTRNITVYGVRDYGDQGVVEYVTSELIRYLHGFGDKQWKKLPEELTGLKVGIV